MTSILRQIVAGPRAPHAEAGLDLCYVTDQIIATSGPSGTYPQRAYRNPLSTLVKFLDQKHKENWAIWEFRAEGTGYPDSEVYGRIWHYPWPDHHPPPFALIPNIMASMRNWLHENENRVVVVHCKAGKGRSGTVSCSYLVSEEGWTVENAIGRFTERRMRPGFGAGVSIPSQLRWLTYVDRWTKYGKMYVERQIEIVELKVFGLRDGAKITIEGFVDEGKVIKCLHTFEPAEREITRGKIKDSMGLAGIVAEVMAKSSGTKEKSAGTEGSETSSTSTSLKEDGTQEATSKEESPGGDAIFRPRQRILVPTNDVNIDFERRNTAAYSLTMVTAVAHVWFNAFFEGNGPEQHGRPDMEGVFSLDWDKMDGIKGSSRKGARGFDRFEVRWKVHEPAPAVTVPEPQEGEEVKQAKAADWRGAPTIDDDNQNDLGIRTKSPKGSTDAVTETKNIVTVTATTDAEKGLKAHGQNGESSAVERPALKEEVQERLEQDGERTFDATDQASGNATEEDSKAEKNFLNSTASNLLDQRLQEDMKTAKEHQLGHLQRKK